MANEYGFVYALVYLGMREDHPTHGIPLFYHVENVKALQGT